MQSHPSCVGLFGAVSLVLSGWLVMQDVRAEDSKTGVAAVTSEDGTVLARPELGKPWQVLNKGDAIPAGDMLVGMPGSSLVSANKAVRVTLLSDLEKKSPFPIVESAVVLREAKDVDLDLTLDRGRIEVAGLKEMGDVKVRVRFRTRVWEMTLQKPGTKFQMLIFARWPAGSLFSPERKEGDEPHTTVVLMVTEGKLQRQCDRCQVALTAPPGPATFSWDSRYGDDDNAKKVETLPEWAADPKPSPALEARKQRVELVRRALVARGPEYTIKEFLHSDDSRDREFGMNAIGALDRLDLLADALTRTGHMDTWNYAVVALRHWVSRAPGQDRILYDRLIKDRGYTPVHAQLVLQLLFGFTEEQISRPAMYQVLIGMLRHEKLAVRGLAYWHLQKLAPGVSVKFNPAGSEKDWDAAVDAYRKAIPPGKLPPAPKLTSEK